jgi:hypothetical protein
VNVRSWHKADIDFDGEHACFRGESGIPTDISYGSMKRLYQYQSASPQDEEGMSMSKNGNKIAVVGGASRIGCERRRPQCA